MATKISSSDLSAAAELSLERKLSNGQSRRGESADQEEWASLRAKASRLFLTDPDALVYLYFLASNRVASLMSRYHGILCECIVIAESSVSSVAPDDADLEKEAAAKTLLSSTVEEIRSLPEGTPYRSRDLGRLRETTLSYASSVAARSTRKRKIERKASSLRDLFLLCEEASAVGQEILLGIVDLYTLRSNVDSLLRDSAQSTILPNMAATLRQEDLDPKEEILSLISALSSYEMLGNRVAVSEVAHSLRAIPFTFSVSSSGTSLRFRDSSGAPIDPQLLRIKEGYSALSGSQSSTVQSLSDDSIELASEVDVTAGVVIRSPAQVSLVALSQSARAMTVSDLPTVKGAASKVRVREMSRPEAFRLVSTLSGIAARLAPLNSEASRSASLLEVEVPETGNYIQTLTAFSPEVPKSSSAAVLATLEALRSKGLDMAVDSLLKTRVSVLSTISVEEVRTATAVTRAVGNILNIISPTTRV